MSRQERRGPWRTSETPHGSTGGASRLPLFHCDTLVLSATLIYMFKNKHVIIALLVAPMLAIMAWFAVDYFVAERPEAANPGSSYPLVAKPNCRRLSDGCELTNADLTLTVIVTRSNAMGATVELTSAVPLERAFLGFANDGVDEGPPAELELVDAERLVWSGQVSGRIDADTAMRVLVRVNDASFFAEVPVTFFYTE